MGRICFLLNQNTSSPTPIRYYKAPLMIQASKVYDWVSSFQKRARCHHQCVTQAESVRTKSFSMSPILVLKVSSFGGNSRECCEQKPRARVRRLFVSSLGLVDHCFVVLAGAGGKDLSKQTISLSKGRSISHLGIQDLPARAAILTRYHLL